MSLNDHLVQLLKENPHVAVNLVWSPKTNSLIVSCVNTKKNVIAETTALPEKAFEMDSGDLILATVEGAIDLL